MLLVGYSLIVKQNGWMHVANLNWLLHTFFKLVFCRTQGLWCNWIEIWKESACFWTRFKHLGIELGFNSHLFHEWPVSWFHLDKLVFGIMIFVLMPIIKLVHKHINLIEFGFLPLVELYQQLLVNLESFWNDHLQWFSPIFLQISEFIFWVHLNNLFHGKCLELFILSLSQL